MNNVGRLLVGAVCGLIAAAATAQSWPSRPVRVIVGFNPGSPTDIVARITGAEISKRLGQPVIVENRVGAGGDLARTAVATAEPDGHLLLASALPVSSHPIFRKTGGVILGKDIIGLADVASTPVVLLANTNIAKNWQELVAYAKANPNKLNFCSLTNQLDVLMDYVRIQHGMTYTSIRYGGPPVQAMLRSECHFFIGNLPGSTAQIDAGKMSPVLFFAPSSAYPNVPTAEALGIFKATFLSISGYYGPPSLPNDIVQKFSQAALQASKVPELVEGLRKLELEAIHQGPEKQMKDYLALVAAFTEAVRVTGFQPQ